MTTPMRIYTLSADANRYQNIIAASGSGWDRFRDFDGRRLGEQWGIPQVRALIDEEQNKNLPVGDFPALASHIPVFTPRAADALRPLISPFGEFLNLNMEGQELYAFNVTKLVDGLDRTNSVYQTFPDGKRIMIIEKHVFIPSAIEGLPIFKLAPLPLMYVYVSHTFVECVKRNDLKGFWFRPV